MTYAISERLGAPMLMLSQMTAVIGQKAQEAAMRTQFQDLSMTTDAAPGRAREMTVNHDPAISVASDLAGAGRPLSATERTRHRPPREAPFPTRLESTAPPPHGK